MASRNVLFALAALALVAVLVAGVIGSNWLTREAAGLHGPVGCVVLVPALLVFVCGSVVLVAVWRKQRRQ